MATIICMDGLGGRPEVTFHPLVSQLSAAGHKVVFAPIDSIRTHTDRVARVIQAFNKASEDPQEKIFLVGQSAGGSAVRIAAERLTEMGRTAQLKGVIMLSPAMPMGILYMTKPLFKVMLGRFLDLILGRTIHATAEEYAQLVEPYVPDGKHDLVASRIPIPGPEARELALYPNRLRNYQVPTLVLYGDQDRWISPDAHRKLCGRLEQQSDLDVTSQVVSGAGHLTLASHESDVALWKIQNWIERIR